MKLIIHLPKEEAHFRNHLTVLAKAAASTPLNTFTTEEFRAAMAQEGDGEAALVVTSDASIDDIGPEALAHQRACIAVLFESERKKTADLFSQCPKVTNFFAFKRDGFDSSHFVSMLRKWFSRDIFGIDKYLVSGIETHSHAILSRKDKHDALARMRAFLEGFETDSSTRFRSLAELTAVAADELIVNAIFHAVPRLQTSSRDVDFELTPQEEVSMSWAFDGTQFAFSVSDRCGVLQKEKVSEYLEGSLSDDTHTLQSQISAGIGLKFIFSRMNHLIVNVASGRRTEVMGIVHAERSRLEARRHGHSFHYFYI